MLVNAEFSPFNRSVLTPQKIISSLELNPFCLIRMVSTSESLESCSLIKGPNVCVNVLVKRVIANYKTISVPYPYLKVNFLITIYTRYMLPGAHVDAC